MVNVRESRSTIAEASAELPAHTIWFRMSSAAWRPVLLSAASLAIALCTWQFLSTVLFNPFLIPPPLEVFRTAIPMLASGEILTDVSISMSRVLVGFISGSLVGVVMGVLLGRIRLLHDVLDPIMELLRYLSPTAMIPIAVIWFGIGELSKYFLIFWGTFFIVLINTTAESGARQSQDSALLSVSVLVVCKFSRWLSCLRRYLTSLPACALRWLHPS